MKQSAAGYANYQQWLANTQLEQRVSLEDYSVSNRGLRSGLVGTPEQVHRRRSHAFEEAGVDLLLLQCSPQLEEMERFAEQVIAPYRACREPPRPHMPAEEMTGTPCCSLPAPLQERRDSLNAARSRPTSM